MIRVDNDSSCACINMGRAICKTMRRALAGVGYNTRIVLETRDSAASTDGRQCFGGLVKQGSVRICTTICY